jgi:hypothetical protein
MAIVSSKAISEYLIGNGAEAYLAPDAKNAGLIKPWTLVELFDFDKMAELRRDVREAFKQATFPPGLLTYSLYRDTENGHHVAVVRDGRAGHFNAQAKATVRTCLFYANSYSPAEAVERSREWAGRDMAWAAYQR